MVGEIIFVFEMAWTLGSVDLYRPRPRLREDDVPQARITFLREKDGSTTAVKYLITDVDFGANLYISSPSRRQGPVSLQANRRLTVLYHKSWIPVPVPTFARMTFLCEDDVPSRE